MSYIWENYSEKREYQIDEKICPYIEVINANAHLVNVNPLIRFSKLFNASYNYGGNESFALDSIADIIGEEGVRNIINILFHYLSQIDRMKGLDPSQQLIEKIRDEIEAGMWGRKAQHLFPRLTEFDRDCILYHLTRRITDDKQSFFMETIGMQFPISSLCFDTKTHLYYLYIGSEGTDYNVNKLELIKTLFWTINQELNVVWNYHYGIVGCDDTMYIDSIQIVS
ncbi:hypothetical protein [Ruminococcus sp.]|uniref:hypothetical protein n=1 Tax=Ruminococcus sp. TaxID=41978 RepID=UPI0025CE8A84|nr:hypothetical protein [Ruminococcus sp.]